MRVPSGKVDQAIFFVALDSSDRVTRKTGLSSFTVYRSRNGGTATAYTTPTVTELSSSNMPGVYSLTIDEDTTIGSSSDSEEYCVHITCATMAPVTRTIELYRRDTTSGRTLDVSAGGEAGIDWANVGSPTTVVGLSGTTVKTATDVETDTQDIQSRLPAALVSGRMDSSTGAMAANVMTASAAASDLTTELQTGLATASAVATLQTSVDDVPTNAELAAALGSADDAVLAAITALNNISAAQVNAEVDTALADVGLTTIITGRIDAAISTRLGSGSYTAPDNATIAAIEAKTTNLPSDPADQSLVIAATDAVMARIGAPAGASVSADIAATASAVAALSDATANNIFDRVIAAGFTFEEITRLVAAVQLGKATGIKSASQATIRNLEDSADAVTVTFNGSGDRTTVSLDAG